MCDKVHRVVVSLTDTMHKLSNNLKQSPLDEVKILDKTTLLLRMNNGNEAAKVVAPLYYQQLQFDAVGYEDERHVRCEMNELLVQMFRHRRHGCLLRLTPRRAHNVKLLTRLLVSDVDKILLKLPYRLEGINVEYYDVRKFDMLNMLTTKQRNKDTQSRRQMQSTREMFHWLHNEYSVLRGRGTGDDYINVEFVISNVQQKQHKLHLALFHVFDCNERTDIANFFKALPTGKHCKSTLLTDCIKESFDCQLSIYTLVLCEMPMDKECAREMYKFLQLADMASMSTGATQSKTKLQLQSPESASSLQSKSSAKSSTPSLEGQRRMSLRCRPLHLTPEDYSQLAIWYQRIDTKFNELKLSMERHYNVQYRQKFLKICKQLHACRSLSDKCGGDAQRVLFRNSARDLAATTNYVEGLKQFRQLEKEVNKSSFACTLSTYMSTKNYELLNAEKALQEREIDNLREHRSRITF